MARKFNPKHFHSVNGHTYKREVSRTYRRVKSRGAAGASGYVTKELASVKDASLQADFDIRIDVQALVDLMLFRASQTKNGKAAMLGGIVVAQRSNERVLGEVVQEFPVREGDEVLP